MASYLFAIFTRPIMILIVCFLKEVQKMFIEVLVITLVVWFVVQDLRDRRSK